MEGGIGLISGQSFMSMYSVITKMLDLNLFTQVMTRFGTLGILGFLFGNVSLLNIVFDVKFWMISILQLVHVYSSYAGFINLSSGMAMSLFYLYPIFGLFMSGIFDIKLLFWFFISCIGVFIMNIDKITNNKNFYIGLIAIIIAALTEAYNYVYIKNIDFDNVFNSLTLLYLLGFVMMILILLIKPKIISTNKKDIAKSIGFNASFGFIGAILTYWALRVLPTHTFLNLAYPSVITAYLAGWILLKEVPTKYDLIGTTMILYSVYMAQKI